MIIREPNNMKKLFKVFLLYLLGTLYFFDMPLFFLPIFIRVRFFLGLIGILYFLYVFKGKINKKVVYNIFLLLVLIFPFIVTTILNGHMDKWGLRPILNVFVYFAGFLLIYFLQKENISTISKIIKFLVNVVVINIIIAVIMFVNPNIKELFFKIQGVNTVFTEGILYVTQFRLFGLGNFFTYQGGVYCSWTLLLIVFLIRNSISKREKVYLFISYIFVLSGGMVFARTTMVGFVFSIIYYIFPSYLSVKNIKLFVSKSVVFLFFLLILFVVLINDSFRSFMNEIAQNNKMFSHSFELILNYLNGNGLTSKSTEHLATMYVFPDNLKTWLFGDGFFTDVSGKGYYMSTDIGYLRIIFFIGLFGLILMYIQKVGLIISSLILCVLDEKKEFRLLVIMMFLYTIVINFKGFTDLDTYVFLFFWHYMLRKYKFNGQKRL